jgi:para-nitrobenzyl esterase
MIDSTRKTPWRDALNAVLMVAAFTLLTTSAQSQTKTDPIDTRLGKIVGIQNGNVQVFRGIRYGQPPIGDRRFMPPVPAPGWDGTLDATTYPNRAIQPESALESAFGLEMPRGETNEDCLFLNIFTPSTEGNNRPVLFWIHGGSLKTGSGNDNDGSVLAEQGDVVVVSVTYRLGLFGNLDLSKFGDEFAGSAVLGHQDQILALKWVRDNIADYGGDPNNVTIFGESAGGQSVLSIMASPSADGLYHKAISHSGSMASTPPPDVTGQLAAQLKVKEAELVDALRALTAKELLDLLIAIGDPGTVGLDGHIVTRTVKDAIVDRGAAGVPLIAGTNKDEGTLFAAIIPPQVYGPVQFGVAGMVTEGAPPSTYFKVMRSTYPDDSKLDQFICVWNHLFRRPAIIATQTSTEAGPGGWLYRFDYRSEFVLNDVTLGASHAAEIAFTFNTFADPNNSVAPFYKDDDAAAKKLAKDWSNTVIAFARTGNPNGAGLPQWPRYSADNRQTLILDGNPRIEKNIDVQERQLWKEAGIPVD